MIKDYKIRIYPTKDQEMLLFKHVNCCRFIYNCMLNLQEVRYENGGSFLNYYAMVRILKPLKAEPEYSWLNEVSNKSLAQACKDLAIAYDRFFKGISKHPKFKSKKKAKVSFPVRAERFYFNASTLHVEKIGAIKYKTDYDIPIGKGNKFCDVRIYKIGDKWFVSFGIECESQTSELNDYNMGIDLGIKELAVVAYGNNSITFHNINKSKKIKDLTKRLKHEERILSRKLEQNKHGNKFVITNNIARQKIKVHRLYRKIANIRDNHIHQATSTLVKLKPKVVIMEDLNVKGMLKNKHLSRALSEQSLGTFKEYMKYKCERDGIKFIQVDRFYPSSKTCSCCGSIKKDLKLKDRIYKCPNCGKVIDRDLNAAINLMNYPV